MSRPCCSPYHAEDPRNCYHCGNPVRGQCDCTDEGIAHREAEDAAFMADAMRCWCGACETPIGVPAPCAQFQRNQEWARVDRDEESRPGW